MTHSCSSTIEREVHLCSATTSTNIENYSQNNTASAGDTMPSQRPQASPPLPFHLHGPAAAARTCACPGSSSCRRHARWRERSTGSAGSANMSGAGRPRSSPRSCPCGRRRLLEEGVGCLRVGVRVVAHVARVAAREAPLELAPARDLVLLAPHRLHHAVDGSGRELHAPHRSAQL